MKKKILVVEDEADINEILTFNLEAEGYETVSVTSGSQGVDAAKRDQPDLILLDVMLPEMDGFEVCKTLKADTTTDHIPIIMITAKSSESAIVSGLELGADDYITKPFSIAVLVARVRAALRRPATQKSREIGNNNEILKYVNLSVNTENMTVTVADKVVSLNLTEFKLLATLIARPERIFSRNQLIDAIRGEDYIVNTRLIDVLVVSLRKKLGGAGKMIQTVRGVGYKLHHSE